MFLYLKVALLTQVQSLVCFWFCLVWCLSFKNTEDRESGPIDLMLTGTVTTATPVITVWHRRWVGVSRYSSYLFCILPTKLWLIGSGRRRSHRSRPTRTLAIQTAETRQGTQSWNANGALSPEEHLLSGDVTYLENQCSPAAPAEG